MVSWLAALLFVAPAFAAPLSMRQLVMTGKCTPSASAGAPVRIISSDNQLVWSAAESNMMLVPDRRAPETRWKVQKTSSRTNSKASYSIAPYFNDADSFYVGVSSSSDAIVDDGSSSDAPYDWFITCDSCGQGPAGSINASHCRLQWSGNGASSPFAGGCAEVQPSPSRKGYEVVLATCDSTRNEQYWDLRA